MIETLARALCEADGEIWEYSVDEPNKNSPLYFDSKRDMYLGFARAVLKALETPTPELDHILCVGSDTLCFEMGLEQIDHRGTVLAVFTAMIKAAQEQD